MQVTEEVGLEVEHFQVDIHLIGHALLLVCRLLHPYATFYNRQAAISLLEVLRLAKRAELEFSQTNSSMTDLSVFKNSYLSIKLSVYIFWIIY